MATKKAEVVICGAGIAGISAAYHLAVRHGVRGVVLVDERAPLTLTSDKSTEAYRNWWPGPDDAMVRLMNRSIDLLEELACSSDNRFLMSRRGYAWVTADPARAEAMRDGGLLAESFGAGPLRFHTGRGSDPEYLVSPAEGWEDQPEGADLILDDVLIRQAFPYLSPAATAVLHTRRCGWFSGQQLGMLQLELAREAGVELIEGRVETVETTGGRVTEVRVAAPGGTIEISTPRFVDAAGPFLNRVASLLGLELPVFSELHLKVSIEDHLGVVPREAPLLIWEDPQLIDWNEEVRELLEEAGDTRMLVGQMPAGVHTRPEGGRGSHHILILWPYHAERTAEVFPLPIPEHYAEVCLRGLATMLPGMDAYRERLPRPFIDGGYYTKTEENRPLACRLEVEGAYVHGALSGFGMMVSQATAELLALHLTEGPLPPYAGAFSLDRYDDPDYVQRIREWSASAQL